MKQPIRVLQWGLGAMGGGIARLMLDKPGLTIVAAVDGRPEFAGQDLGEVLGIGKHLGVAVTDEPATVLDGKTVDIVTLATTSWAQHQMPDLRDISALGSTASRSLKNSRTLKPRTLSWPRRSTRWPRRTVFQSWARASTPGLCSTR